MFKSYFQRSLDQFYTIWYFLHTYYEEIWNAICCFGILEEGKPHDLSL